MKRCAFVTLGCKINQYETEAIREEVLALGYEESPPGAPADLFVVNTCSVTHVSGAKSRRAVLRLVRGNPGARIVVMGCSSPEEKELLARIPQVVALLGNEEKGMVPGLIGAGLPQMISRKTPAKKNRLRMPPREDPRITRDILDLRVRRFESRTRAFIKVQDGCNALCSFCIIPYLRGRSRSRGRDSILEEVKRLGGSGCKEVVITGIHLQDYGVDLRPQATLASLLSDLAGAARPEGISRIRLSSLGPRAFTEDLVDLLRDPLFCPHWHIPLQSGSDGVLEIMRRDYRTQDFRRAVEILRSRFSRPSLTTDVIVGHPGETDGAFRETMDLCADAGFSRIHIFPFSPRQGTPSAQLPGKVPEAEVKRRERALEALARELALRYKRLFLGEAVEVLVEEAPPEGLGPDGRILLAEKLRFVEGYTDRYLRVRAPADGAKAPKNTLVVVDLERARPDLLEGRIADA